MSQFPCLIRSSTDAGEVRYVLGDRVGGVLEAVLVPWEIAVPPLLELPDLLPDPDVLSDDHLRRVAMLKAVTDEIRALVDNETVSDAVLIEAHGRFRRAQLDVMASDSLVSCQVDSSTKSSWMMVAQ